MRTAPLTLALAAAVLAGAAVAGEDAAREAAPGAALVEVYTSEGCSSCPPADRAVAAAVRKAREKGLAVFALAWHVDYWDRLGWKDRFASPAHTRRQARIRKAEGKRGLYTPHLLVNGVTVRGKEFGKALSTALKTEPGVDLKLKSVSLVKDPARCRAAYNVLMAPEGAVLLVAVAEGGLTSEVDAGENKGKTLRHEHTVRAFREKPLADAPEGEVELPLPPDLKAANAYVVACVQDPQTMKVLAVVRQPLTAPAEKKPASP
ncbi:MAG: DUF1223 domain-containing protein [Planctomycetota bacterium]|jgi:hypothetical protein